MRVNIITIAFASGLLLSTASFADETTATAPAAAPTADATPAATPAPAVHTADDDVYCRTMTSTGSYISTRVCHTQREWKQIRANSQDAVDRMHSNMTTGGGVRQ